MAAKPSQITGIGYGAWRKPSLHSAQVEGLFRSQAVKEMIHGKYGRQEMRTPRLLLYRDVWRVLQHAVRGDGKDAGY